MFLSSLASLPPTTEVSMSAHVPSARTRVSLSCRLPLAVCLTILAALCLSATAASADEGCANESFRRAQGSTSLPDCRAYELVSPPDKHGADIVPNSFKTVSAADGNGVAFPGLGAFGNVKGTATDVQYIARRTGTPGTNGWGTTAVNPPGLALPLLPLFVGAASSFEAFTPDLKDGIFRSWRSLTEAPNVAGTVNDYRIRDLEAAQSPTDLLSASAQPLNPAPKSNPFVLLTWQTRFVGASTDLTHVFLQSPWNLTGDGSFSSAGDLYEQVEGVGVRRVGRVPSGTSTECDDSVPGPECVDAPSVQAGIPVSLVYGGSAYSSGMVSADGSRILFQGPAGAPAGPIYMREDGLRTFQINASERTTPETPGTAQLWGMSTDGTRIFFTTSESLVNADNDEGGTDLYMWDRTAPPGARLTLLSQDTTGDPGVTVTSVVGNSTDGHYVYFVSDGRLVTEAPSGEVNQGLYVWHDGQIGYIGQFRNTIVADVNTPATSWQAGSPRTSRVSPDGRHLLFMSWTDAGFAGRGGYPGYDHGTCGSFGCRELYLYSADTASLACVSCNPRASAATGDAQVDILPGISASPPMQHESRALSDDGEHVFFSTPEALVAADSNGKWDAYEYDTATGTVHLLSSGTSSSDSYFMDASPDGHDAFFVTRQRLTGWDVDDSYDLYDARVGGGLPEPLPAAQVCTGEGCRPAQTGPPGAAVPGTVLFNGAGNVPPPVVVKPVVKKVSRLTAALNACKKKPKKARKHCESQARKRFGKQASKSRRSS